MAARCQRCHRVLSDEASMAAGYGPSCYRKTFGKSLSRGSERSRSRPTRRSFKAPTTSGKAAKAKALPPLFREDIILYRDAEGNATANIPQRIKYHSPTGFEWGYAGSGPADLALNILAVFIGENRARPLHQEFKNDFLVGMPPDGGIIPKEQILKWIEQHEGTK